MSIDTRWLCLSPIFKPGPNEEESSNSHSHLVWNSCTLSSSTLIEFEPPQIFLENRREFSLVWPTLDDSRWDLKKTLMRANSQQLSSSFVVACVADGINLKLTAGKVRTLYRRLIPSATQATFGVPRELFVSVNFVRTSWRYRILSVWPSPSVAHSATFKPQLPCNSKWKYTFLELAMYIDILPGTEQWESQNILIFNGAKASQTPTIYGRFSSKRW